MNSFDVGASIDTRVGISPKNSTAATTNGTGFDRTGFLSCALHVACGAATGTPTTQSVIGKIQDSADNSTFADVTGATAAALTADICRPDCDSSDGMGTMVLERSTSAAHQDD